MLPRFEALTPMARWSVAKLCEERSFEDGDTLCHQVPREDVEDSFFLLLEGELEERVHLKGKTEPTLVNSYKFQGITKSGPHIVGRGQSPAGLGFGSTHSRSRSVSSSRRATSCRVESWLIVKGLSCRVLFCVVAS